MIEIPQAVSPAWLDQIVEARRRAENANHHLRTLKDAMRRGDQDSNLYHPACEEALRQDGTGWRLYALRNRVATLESEIRLAECHGYTVQPIRLALTEVIDTLEETVQATILMLDQAEVDAVDNDDRIDRLEDLPAYERN